MQRARLAVMLAAVVLVMGIIWAVVNRDQIRSGKNPSLVAHDIALLWQWTDKLYSKGAAAAEWTIRWDLEGEAASLEQAEQQLQADEKGQMQGTLSIFPLTSDSQAMVVYVTKQRTNQKDLLAFVNNAETLFKESGIAYTGGMTVRGEAEYNNAADRLAQAAGGKRIDRYKDDSGTVSEAYYSEKLFSSVEAGAGKKANLQIAEHRETESGVLSLIVGTPLITGDYTVSEQGND
ncbi:YwmB family TATA-box binding protein [Paenibacillus glycanilyticus]|uniref:YwmB family TATA-box binding protein n=1 Tax=Paenibacillus glycanilyticus TaxID=126569 RepID=UPI00204220F8|nr:YwmB family TATA-box binding protein [Paenibacillus glycanilyticus]MCM3628689.1 YwmB family TATA-box binding protein [Paenibacillus glycanilyticus]